MATVTSLTAERMEAIEAASVVDGNVVGDNLILTRFDDSTIDAGSVRGPTGSPGITEAEMSDHMPVGIIQDYIGTTAPNAKWLLMTGQTVTNGQTLYTALWAKLPASMKSGSSIIMPDTRGRMSVGYNSGDTDFDTIGETGGAKTHALTTAELASHTHTGPSHTHTGTTGNENLNHVHALSTGVVDSGGSHVHGISIMGNVVQSGGGPYLGVTDPGSNKNTDAGGTHSHTLSGNVNTQSQFHQHAFTTAAGGTAATGATGSGTAHNNMPPYITLQKMIKVL